MPAVPNPPIITVAPSLMPATAAAGDSTTLVTTRTPFSDSVRLHCTTTEPAASSGVPVLTRAANAAARWSARWVPNAFVIACLLTLVVFALVIAVAGKNPIAAQGYWVKGFWELLELAMQLSLIVLTGYVVAVSPAVSRLLEFMAGLATTTPAPWC